MNKLYKTTLLFLMQKFLAAVGAVGLILSTYSTLANIRKAELSYALPSAFYQGKAISRCYPTTFDPPKEVQHVQTDNYQYYEVIAKGKFPTTDSSTTTLSTLYFRVGVNTCKWLNRNDLVSGRLKFMPSQVAIALAKQRYSKVIKNCSDSLPKKTDSAICTKQLEDAINQPPNWASSQVDYLFPDDATALNELGTRTDKVLIVESIQDLKNRKKAIRGNRYQHKISQLSN